LRNSEKRINLQKGLEKIPTLKIMLKDFFESAIDIYSITIM